MTGFLAELGSKLADRWAAALVVPGLLFLAVVSLAVRLGQRRALSVAALRSAVDQVAASPASHSTGAVLLASMGVLAGSVGVALVASVLGKALERVWLWPGGRWPVLALRRWRASRWATADERVRLALAAAPVDRSGTASASAAPPDADTATDGPGAAIAARDAISLVPPERPTWIGDRFRAVDERVARAYGLDLGAAWPGIWTIAPPELRGDLTTAQDAYVSAARLVGWGLLYLVISPWWWPSAVIGVITLAAGWGNARSATQTYASLVETAVDLYGGNLARQLGLNQGGPLSPAIGYEITQRLRKDYPAAGSG